MKLFTNLRNKYFTFLLALALLVLSSVGLFNLCTPQSVEASMIKFDNEKTISITNGSFSSFSSQSSYPYLVNNFSTSGNKTPEMKTGVINISDGDYSKNYEKYGMTEFSNPKGVGTDNYILMINAETTSNYTYTSSEFTLPANGYYYVTVSAKTLGENSCASVFLTKDGAVYNNCAIQNITSTTWSNYTFFVATNSYESVTLKFGMQIGNLSGGASGCVLFDELHAGEISENTMNDAIKTLDDNSFKVVDNRTTNAYKEYNFDNKIVTYDRNNKGELIEVANGYQTTEVSDNYFKDITSGSGEKYIDIVNNTVSVTLDNSYIAYKGLEETLEANTNYRFSMFVKASNLSKGSAYVELNEILDEEDEYEDFMNSTKDEITAKSSKLTISSVTSNNIADGYKEYSIYVRTGALQSSKVQFSFGFGTSEENAIGSVSFKDYKIERVPYSAFSNASTGSEVGKIDIAERISLSSNEYSNYTFDKMESSSFDGIAYPAKPSSWTQNSDNIGYQLSGVVNLSQFNKVMQKYDASINKIATPTTLNNTLNNNVLMIYNGTQSTQSYTSSSKSLSANKYYKVTTFVNTHIWSAESNGVTILAKVGSNILGKAENIKTEGSWQRVEFYINTPNNSVDVTFELALGNGTNLSSGYAFFDNILVEESDTANDFSTRFNEYTLANNGKVELDLSNPMLSGNEGREYNSSILFSATNKGTTVVNAGIVDLKGDLKMVAESKRKALGDVTWDNKNALAIVTALEEDSYFEYSSLINYSFTSDKYYRLSFELFTDGFGQTEKEEKYDNGVLAEGLNIELTNLENAKFNYVQSNGKWTGYEVYIGVDSAVTSNLVFTLGSEFTGCYGKAFVGNIVLEEVEESVFTSAEASETLLKVDTIKQEEEEDTPTAKEDKSSNFSWAYIPTIATFAAIVVAVIGIFVRRNIKFKKHVKTGKAEYDRDITVLQNKYRRLAQDQRDKDIRELQKEYKELVEVRAEYEDKYKEALSRLRSAKLSNRDGSKRHEIMAIEHEVKHISKEVARLGVQVNNYENEIEFMQTEAYLIDLEKHMMREDNSTRSQLRKESAMTEELRAQAIAKREAKQAKLEAKASAKAEKIASKKAKLQQEREAVQNELAQAKELDEKYLKEQELKQIKLQEIKLAKEQAKAQKELEKLEKQRAKQEQMKAEVAETENEENSEETATVQPGTETQNEQVESEVKAEESVEQVDSVNQEEKTDIVNESNKETVDDSNNDNNN